MTMSVAAGIAAILALSRVGLPPRTLPSRVQPAQMIPVSAAAAQPGKALARVHAPDAYGGNVLTRRSTVGEALAAGMPRKGSEPGRDNIIAFASAVERQGQGAAAREVAFASAHPLEGAGVS